MKKILIPLGLFLWSALAFAAPVDLKVKPGALNRITFAAPFEAIVVSPNSPLAAEPSAIGGEQTIVMHVVENATKPFQIIATLIDGSIIELMLTPDAGAKPLSWTQDRGFEAPPADSPARVPIQRPQDDWIKEVFYEVVQGRKPNGFSRINPPAGGQVGTLTANYVAAFRNQNYLLLVMTLHSNIVQWIAPQDLYAPGVKAVVIDGDRVGGVDAPVAYVLMTAE